MEQETKRALSHTEYSALTSLMACASEVEYMQPYLSERLRGMTRTGWRDLRMVSGVMRRLVGQICGTVPDQKRLVLRKQAEHTRIKLCYGPQAAADPDIRLVPGEDLGVIITAAAEQCKLCMGTAKQCRACLLGRALDSAAWFDRGQDAWWEVFATGG